jgi:hypothetical protein
VYTHPSVSVIALQTPDDFWTSKPKWTGLRRKRRKTMN